MLLFALLNVTTWLSFNIKVTLVTLVKGEPKAPFSKLIHQGVGEGGTPFPELLHFTLDPYLYSAKQGSIKYHFLSLWYDSTWDWTLVFQTIGKHSTQ